VKPKKEFMKKAINAAIVSGKKGDYAIGAVIVKDNKIISKGYETLKSDFDPVNGHAEIDAIRKACKKLNEHYLKDCILYSTHEPCPMCTSASIWAKIGTIVYGVSREDMIRIMKKRSSGKFSWRQIDISCQYILKKEKPNSNIKLIPGFMKKECLKLFNLSN
jgi:tRNA(Arg) A34 adenosine deaminase TadA